MQFEYDPEKLIEEVKKRPGIWDFNSVDYRTKRTRQALWGDVVKEMNIGSTLVSKSDLRELELQLQKKWKSIRDCFMKYVAKPSRSRRPYIYYKKLQFLLHSSDSTAPPAPVDPESSDSDSAGKKKFSLRKTCSLTVRQDDSDEDNLDDNCDNNSANNSEVEDEVRSPPAKIPKYNQSVDQFAFANVDAVPKPDSDNDPDRLFLLSLLPHLKSVPEAIRLNVKMELMQVLHNANYSIVRDQKL